MQLVQGIVAPMLPWFREPAELPGPLPTRTEIETATTELPSIYTPGVKRTVLVNGLFVVKYGPLVFENEGHALLVVESRPDIPAPRLFAMYREDGILYIIMEFVHGRQLSSLWPSLAENEKQSIVGQLKSACDSFRSIPSPGIYGGALGGPVPHPFFFSLEKDPRITGPFANEKDLHDALVLRSEKNWESYHRRGWISEFFARHVSRTLVGHDSIFTHADFQRKNILVEEDRSSHESSHSAPDNPLKRSFRVTAILDWESAGWYPTYWEYSLCLTYFSWDDDWPEKVEKILDPFVTEAALLKLIARDLDQ